MNSPRAVDAETQTPTHPASSYDLAERCEEVQRSKLEGSLQSPTTTASEASSSRSSSISSVENQSSMSMSIDEDSLAADGTPKMRELPSTLPADVKLGTISEMQQTSIHGDDSCGSENTESLAKLKAITAERMAIARPRLTEAEKKHNHIASEQKRRAAIREGFDRLTMLVPGIEGQARSESVVLRQTVDFMKSQMEEKQRLLREIQQREGKERKPGIGSDGVDSDGRDNGLEHGVKEEIQNSVAC